MIGIYERLQKLTRAGKWREALGLMRSPGLPSMFRAFRTTQSRPDRYEMVFAFRSLEEMQQADREWHEFRKAIGA